MNTEQAIAIFEGNGGSDTLGAIALAIVALREKQEREKGCKWCMRGEHRDVVGNAHNYCPWCGRKLIEGAEHEEE